MFIFSGRLFVVGNQDLVCSIFLVDFLLLSNNVNELKKKSILNVVMYYKEFNKFKAFLFLPILKWTFCIIVE